MSANHYTEITTAFSFKASQINVPLGELDAAITANAAAINGTVVHNMTSDADYTLSSNDLLNKVVEITDTGTVLTTSRNILISAASKVFWVKNSTAQALTFKTAAGTGVLVATNKQAWIHCDGTDCEEYTVSASGDVTGPASNTADYVPQWNGADSKTLKNGLAVVTSVGTPGSDSNIPTEAAVRAAMAGGGLYNVIEDTTPQLGGDLDLNQKSIDLSTALGTDLTAVGLTDSVTVDTNATGIGAALYMAADGNYDEADADSAATMPVTALALEAGTGTKKILLQGYIRKDAWTWTPGGLIYADVTTGGMSQTAPTASGAQVQVVGWAKSSNVMYFNPSLVLVEIV